MQTTKKSKIFLVLLFLAALFFVSCSFEDTLGTSIRNTGSGGSGGNGDSGNGGGSSIPKTYYGKYTKVGRDPSYITVSNDNNGDYIMQDGGNKEYVKDLVYAGENSWKQVVSTSGYYSTTWQYTLKTENNRRILYFTCIKTYIPKNYSSTNFNFLYFHDNK